jgi:hypothetical protein
MEVEGEQILKFLFPFQLSRVRPYGFFVFRIRCMEWIFYMNVRLSAAYPTTLYQLKLLLITSE